MSCCIYLLGKAPASLTPGLSCQKGKHEGKQRARQGDRAPKCPWGSERQCHAKPLAVSAPGYTRVVLGDACDAVPHIQPSRSLHCVLPECWGEFAAPAVEASTQEQGGANRLGEFKAGLVWLNEVRH